MSNPTIKAAYCFQDSFETGDTISIDTTDASMVVVAHGDAVFTTATLGGKSADVLNSVVVAWGRITVFARPLQSTSISFTWTQSQGSPYIWILVLSGTVTSGSTIGDFFTDTYEFQGAATVWSYDRTAAGSGELIISCFAQQSQGFDSITDGTTYNPSYLFDATSNNMLIGYHISTGANAYSVEVTATAFTNAYAIGFVPKYKAPLKVKCKLADRAGNLQQSLTSLSWAWFDNTDPQNFVAPTDTGTTEVTDPNGIIEITLTGTSLVSGQEGCLALMTSDNVDMGLYKLKVY